MAIISLSGRTWVANDTVDQNIGFPNGFSAKPSSHTFEMDFVCNGVAYTKMVANDGNYTDVAQWPLQYYKSDNTKVQAATGTKWYNTIYKTLTFPEGGNGHTNFATILFLYRNGKFSPDIEELKDYKTVELSFDTTNKSARLLIYPYSNNTEEQLGGWLIDYNPRQDEIVDIPFYKDIIYSFRATNLALSRSLDVSLDGQKLDGHSGGSMAVANCYRIKGGETITVTENYNEDTTTRWAFGLGEVETPKTTITYNDEVIATLEAGQTATIKTAGTEVDHDIVVKAGGAKAEEAESTHALYNGVKLPKIPKDVLAQYPYAWIRNNTTSGYYDLLLSDTPFYWLDSDSGVKEGNLTQGKPWYRVSISTAETARNWENNTSANTFSGWGIDNARTVLWSNHDIPDGSATATDIYFKGTEPVPIEEEPEEEPSTATTITYNNETIASLKAGQTATIKCANTEVDHDIVVSAKAEEEEEAKYLTFSSPSSFTLKTNNSAKNWEGTLEYSTDTSTWNTWDGTTTLSADSGKLYLRGTGNTKITGGSGEWVLSGSNIACEGNIENLLDYATVSNGEHPSMATKCYRNMFRNCTNLISIPALPATTLADYCYREMFASCTNIKISATQTEEYKTAYKMPTSGAGAMASNSLYYMFLGTGGTFTGTPSINTTYYTSNEVVY